MESETVNVTVNVGYVSIYVCVGDVCDEGAVLLTKIKDARYRIFFLMK